RCAICRAPRSRVWRVGWRPCSSAPWPPPVPSAGPPASPSCGPSTVPHPTCHMPCSGGRTSIRPGGAALLWTVVTAVPCAPTPRATAITTWMPAKPPRECSAMESMSTMRLRLALTISCRKRSLPLVALLSMMPRWSTARCFSLILSCQTKTTMWSAMLTPCCLAKSRH
ncbi:hypothetical protein LPJ73_005282, partial [Coemansia sp. RSA 2703]